MFLYTGYPLYFSCHLCLVVSGVWDPSPMSMTHLEACAHEAPWTVRLVACMVATCIMHVPCWPCDAALRWRYGTVYCSFERLFQCLHATRPTQHTRAPCDQAAHTRTGPRSAQPARHAALSGTRIAASYQRLAFWSSTGPPAPLRPRRPRGSGAEGGRPPSARRRRVGAVRRRSASPQSPAPPSPPPRRARRSARGLRRR